MTLQPPPRPALLITRPRDQGERFAAEVEAALPGRWDCVLAPVMEIRFRDTPPDLKGVTDIVFTSANGVAALSRLTGARDFRTWCVGERTTDAARDAGFPADLAGATVSEAAETLAGQDLSGRHILHAHGAHKTGTLVERLTGRGSDASEVALYDQVAVPLPDAVRDGLAAGRFRAVALFSPRSARLYRADPGGAAAHGNTVHLCLSDAVAGALGPLPQEVVRIAATPDSPAIIAELAKL